MTEVKITIDGVEVTTQRYAGYKELWPLVRLGRNAIRRLEVNYGFPTRRMPGPRGRVYFFKAEVDRWMADPARKRAYEKEREKYPRIK